MTTNKAIEIIKCFFRENNDCQNIDCETQSPQCKAEREIALDMAIEALEWKDKAIVILGEDDE